MVVFVGIIQGPTIPAKILSKEYFTYYIIIGILLGGIISPNLYILTFYLLTYILTYI